MTHQQANDIIKWAVDAAEEQIEIAQYSGQEPSFDMDFGLWQSFQEAFPKETFSDYDMAITVASNTYTRTITAMWGMVK